MNFAGRAFSAPETSVLASDVASVPDITAPSGLQGPFVALMVNPDAPPPPDSSRPEFIHWIQADLTADVSGRLSSSSAPFRAYQAPAPIQRGSPLHFIVLVFQQSAPGFSVPSAFARYSSGNPTGFNTSQFALQGGLELAAANYVNGLSRVEVKSSSHTDLSADTSMQLKRLSTVATVSE
ncbi:hypothetical protein NQ176_g3512 [Zarea fungicola]|uniref:Uncharacterized protein n=1 Tax=Zarea fungicola TaxID=93591 RepID=A0ACC1NJL6_9HYPO|nr:hypothetical protein NQ176_g3512 [Lecanicillium fungicola]